eukprot:scaffold1706_cov116-Cylindrotheca_fusiformis.AAC.9
MALLETLFEERDQYPFLSCRSDSLREGTESPLLIDDLDDGRPRVRFAPVDKEESMARSPPTFYPKLTREICIENWYQPMELLRLKQEARDDAMMQSASVDKCGLERYNWERIRLKKKAIQELLKAQEISRETAFLRTVLHRRSKESIWIAVRQGCKVYHQVHGSPNELVSPNTCTNYKRKAWDCPPTHAYNQRRVRQRTISPSVSAQFMYSN